MLVMEKVGEEWSYSAAGVQEKNQQTKQEHGG